MVHWQRGFKNARRRGLTMQHLTKYAYGESFLFKAGLYFLKPALKQLRNITDWRYYGGAPILGFDRLCIKAHGRSQKRAMENTITRHQSGAWQPGGAN